MGGAVPSVFVPLPKDASGISYVDEVGNVSTSQIMWDRGLPILNLQPRYPLFGGWNYTWTHTFHVPLSNYLKSQGGSAYKLVDLPLASLFQTVPVERLQVTIVFPEGASNTAFSVPFTADSVERDTLYTYLDTAGRPTVTILKGKVSMSLVDPFEVTYNLPPYQFAQKPVVLIASFFLVFMIFIILARVDFSIHAGKDNNEEKKRKTE